MGSFRTCSARGIRHENQTKRVQVLVAPVGLPSVLPRPHARHLRRLAIRPLLGRGGTLHESAIMTLIHECAGVLRECLELCDKSHDLERRIRELLARCDAEPEYAFDYESGLLRPIDMFGKREVKP